MDDHLFTPESLTGTGTDNPNQKWLLAANRAWFNGDKQASDFYLAEYKRALNGLETETEKLQRLNRWERDLLEGDDDA
jgi:hypothetical protein